MASVIRATGGSLGYDRAHAEYFRIDATFFSYQRYPKGLTNFLWNLELAVEHENNAGEWRYEWVKLMHIGAGLRVVIGYDHPRGIPQRLQEAASLRRHSRYAVPGPMLLILGPVTITRDSAFQAFEFGRFTPRQLTSQIHLHL
ncbi:MAG TPA: hypothetical protein VNL98_13020 [Gemmatimonadales bacterium]|nr:hypothetical protein [Gemmatimonadales bacterium]